MFYEGVLLMETILDSDGRPAPRLIEAAIPREKAAEWYADLRAQAVKMLACDLVHGDLSPYNVLLAWNGPTVIDFPQVIGAAHNSQAERFFERDLETLRRFFLQHDPALSASAGDAREIWRAFVRRELTPDFVPTGKHAEPGRQQERRPERPHGHGERREWQPSRDSQQRQGRPQGQPRREGPRPEGRPQQREEAPRPDSRPQQRQESPRPDARPQQRQDRPRPDARPHQRQEGPRVEGRPHPRQDAPRADAPPQQRHDGPRSDARPEQRPHSLPQRQDGRGPQRGGMQPQRPGSPDRRPAEQGRRGGQPGPQVTVVQRIPGVAPSQPKAPGGQGQGPRQHASGQQGQAGGQGQRGGRHGPGHRGHGQRPR
jgi:RIO kinase 1